MSCNRVAVCAGRDRAATPDPSLEARAEIIFELSPGVSISAEPVPQIGVELSKWPLTTGGVGYEEEANKIRKRPRRGGNGKERGIEGEKDDDGDEGTPR